MNNLRARFSEGHRPLINFRNCLDRKRKLLSIMIGYRTASLQQICWKIHDEGPYSCPANDQAYRTNNGRAPSERKSVCAGSRRYYSKWFYPHCIAQTTDYLHYNIQQNDLITWLLKEARGPQRTMQQISLRVLTVNFAAIHTTSMVSAVYIRCTMKS